MELNQTKPDFQYKLLQGAKWRDDASESVHIVNFDGESLMPLSLTDGFSAFTLTVFLPKDPMKFRREQGRRFHMIRTSWPLIKQLMIHAKNRNEALFDRTVIELGWDDPLTDWRMRLRAEIWSLEAYGLFFRPFTDAEEALIRQRINLAESICAKTISNVVSEFQAAHSTDEFIAEFERIRDAFSRVYPALSALYTCFYWDAEKHTLDDFTLAEKRFQELKTLYVDMYETLCRVSVLAAGLEGVISNGSLGIPATKRLIPVGEFLGMDNGVKPDILKTLAIGDLFVPHMNHKLRNGLGHHTAAYDVRTDSVHYKNRNRAGVVTNGIISYVRFCEAVVRLYCQLETLNLYVAWYRGRAAGLQGRIV